MSSSQDDPSLTLSARAGWLRSAFSEVLGKGPAWGGWALAGYMLVGHSHNLMELTSQNAVVLANMHKLLEAHSQAQDTHDQAANDDRRDLLRISFIRCLNDADDVVKRQLCYASMPDDIADEVRAWRTTREPR